MPDGNFIRRKSGTRQKHGKHIRSWKKRKGKRLILANPSQRRLLRKLVPHFRTTRRTYAGVDVYKEWGHLVKP